MYPLTFFETFMRYEASDQVFVAMPFTPAFQRAYETTLEPAIRAVQVSGKCLQPRIINRGTTGSPDIHEQIFDAIVHSRLVLADMTVQSMYKADDGTSRWQANANVAYEVGLACAWRNPEDILLIHQPHPQHSYSFDIQNLRHVPYEPAAPFSIRMISDEIVRAINTSRFSADRTFLKLVQGLSPCAIQYMRQESSRAFPVVAFNSPEMGILTGRINAVTELLACGALKNRNVIPQGEDKGVAVLYRWTELGLRMLLATHAIDEVRLSQLRDQIASVREESLPPMELLTLPDAGASAQDTKPPSNAQTSSEEVKTEERNA